MREKYQPEIIDNTENYTPVACTEILHLMLSVFVKMLERSSTYKKGAFKHATLPENIIISLSRLNGVPSAVCRVISLVK